MAKRIIATAAFALGSLLGLGTASADGVRPDACWTAGDPCDNAPGPGPGVCAESTCTSYGPIDCAGAAGQAGESGSGNSGSSGVCLGDRRYACLLCLPGTAGGGGSGGAHGGGAGTTGGGKKGSGGANSEAGGGAGAEGGTEAGEGGRAAEGGRANARAGSTGAVGAAGRANGGGAGSSGGTVATSSQNSGCGCRVGRADDERSLAGFMLFVGLTALGVSRRRASRARGLS
ncbi:MAG TPA: hypothetical protein VMI54_17455 [Polyangiaceae bacterium]|nr:hypothetical protein [Polyangiaceae bacterium]